MKQDAILTQREDQVAELIALGHPKKIVADKLVMSERTVENHARSIYEKVEVNCAVELCLWYLCRRFQINPVLIKPILSACFLLLVFTNEFNNEQANMRRVQHAKVVKGKKGKNKNEDETTI